MKSAAAVLLLAVPVSISEPVTMEYDLSGWVSLALENSPDILISDADLETCALQTP